MLQSVRFVTTCNIPQFRTNSKEHQKRQQINFHSENMKSVKLPV